MRYVLAFIAPDQLTRVRDALVTHHVHGMSVSDARGFGQEHDPSHPEHREFVGLEMSRKLRLEIVCHDEELESVMTAIYSAGHTGHRGDGKIFVMPVIDAMRLKTGERGEGALGAKSG